MAASRIRTRILIDCGLCLLGDRGRTSLSSRSRDSGERRVSGIVKAMPTVISMSKSAKYDGSQIFRRNSNPEIAGPIIRVSWPIAPRRKKRFVLITDNRSVEHIQGLKTFRSMQSG